jgi:hypothetical protein
MCRFLGWCQKSRFLGVTLSLTVGLHVAIRTPSIGVDSVNTPRNCLLREPDLVLVVPRQWNEVELMSPGQ